MKKPILFALIGVLFLVFCYHLFTHKGQAPTMKPTQAGYVAVEHGRLFYQRFGAGKPIVVLHGGPGLDQSYLLPQMLELAKDHELIFYDQRGGGKSLGGPMDANYINMEKFVADLERLRVALGLKDIVLLGHSWGGRLALHYAIAHPDKVSQLILMSPSPVDAEGWQLFMQELQKRTEPIKDKIKAVFSYQEAQKMEPQVIEAEYREFFSVFFERPSNARYLTLEANKDAALSGFLVRETMFQKSPQKPGAIMMPILKTLKIPTLIIHGQQDIIPIQTAEQLKDELPNAQMVTLEHCGHFPYIEQPKETFSVIRTFLRQPEDSTSKHALLKIQAMADYQAWS